MTFFAPRDRASGVYITGPRQRLSAISWVFLLPACSGSASPPAAGPTSVGAHDLASRANDDGTLSFVTISPGPVGFNFVVGNARNKRALTVREAQYEYVFVEAG
jgi:hypothetical protein